MHMIQYDLKHKIDTIGKQIESALVPIELLSVEESQRIIKRYVAAIEGNFQYWLATTLITSRSIFGRSITEENFRVEIQENHCSMLRKFAVNANAEPDATDYRAVSKAVECVRCLVAELSGLKCIALMAILESDGFLYPYIADLARKTGSNDFTYTDIHEVEDPDHADQLYKALAAEVRLGYDNPEQQIDEVISALLDLYHSIFEPENYPNQVESTAS